MPTMREFQKKLSDLNVHELGEEIYLKSLCELGLEFYVNRPSELGEAFHLRGSINGRIAEVLGVADTEFISENMRDILDALNEGRSVETISRMFTGAPVY